MKVSVEFIQGFFSMGTDKEDVLNVSRIECFLGTTAKKALFQVSHENICILLYSMSACGCSINVEIDVFVKDEVVMCEHEVTT